MSKNPDQSGRTIVITGASSGIGRATAQALARPGVRLVLAARRAAELAQVVAECEARGAQAQAVPTDTTDAAAVHRLAQAAADFGDGQIDVWVNNAGAGAIGPFTEIPLAVHEQVLKINLLGYLYGAYAVLPYFRRQPGGGTLINVVSLGAWLPEPYTAAYSASKYGVRGLMDTLRTELSAEPHIHVCDVHPAYIDTPGFQHGANYTGRRIKPAPPVFPPQQVAAAIVGLLRRPQASVMVGWTGPALRLLYSLAPGATRWAGQRLIQRYLAQAPRVPITDGSLFAPRPAPHGAGVSGGWRKPAGAGRAGWEKWLGAAVLAAAVGWFATQRADDVRTAG